MDLILLSDRWIVINKSAGVLSVRPSPTEKNTRPVLAEQVEERWGQVFPVHRLDVDTSGVIVYARSTHAQREASTWFEKRMVRKRYVALVSPAPQTPLVKQDLPIEGKPARTLFSLQDKFQAGVVGQVLAEPATGRRHQIRIHARAAGFPLLGDLQYGGPTELRVKDRVIRISRVALHAESIRFPSGEEFVAPLPMDWVKWVEELKQ